MGPDAYELIQKDLRQMKNDILELNNRLSMIIDNCHLESSESITDTQMAITELAKMILDK